MNINIYPAGDMALAVVFGQEICPEIYERISGFCAALKTAELKEIIEYVPAYCCVTVQYDPILTNFEQLSAKLMHIFHSADAEHTNFGKTVEIPVCYGGEYGVDLPFVASHSGLSEQQVIDIHRGVIYPVYMMGFTPGFPYLGGMDRRIATPRLQSPRASIAAGSVGIAGGQTGVYPIASPGGWQLIGRTPIKLFDIESQSPFLLCAGDKIKFVPITKAEFASIAGGQK